MYTTPLSPSPGHPTTRSEAVSTWPDRVMIVTFVTPSGTLRVVKRLLAALAVPVLALAVTVVPSSVAGAQEPALQPVADAIGEGLAQLDPVLEGLAPVTDQLDPVIAELITAL